MALEDDGDLVVETTPLEATGSRSILLGSKQNTHGCRPFLPQLVHHDDDEAFTQLE